MKKTLIVISPLLCLFCVAQAQNTFPANGNVGIGTTSAQHKLEVIGDIAIPIGSTIFYDGSNGSSIRQDNTGSFNMNASTAGGGNGNIVLNPANGAGTYLNFSARSNIFFCDGNSNITGVIQSNGNMGIGTNDPKGYKLAVAGKAIAESVTVKLQSQWPDYLFEPNYSLPGLPEIKTYIEQNHHLPEMPPESQIKDNGINLGEINIKLLRKVEELTLYLIEQHKEIQYMKKEIAELKGHNH